MIIALNILVQFLAGEYQVVMLKNYRLGTPKRGIDTQNRLHNPLSNCKIVQSRAEVHEKAIGSQYMVLPTAIACSKNVRVSIFIWNTTSYEIANFGESPGI